MEPHLDGSEIAGPRREAENSNLWKMIELNLKMLIDGHETRRAPSNIFLGMYHSQPNTNKPTKKRKNSAAYFSFL
jgi:hypothetical protein